MRASIHDAEVSPPSVPVHDTDFDLSRASVRPPLTKRTVRIEIGLKSVLLVGASVLAVWLFRQLYDVVLVLVVALMLAGTMAPIVAWFERKGLGRGKAIAATYTGLLLLMGAFATLTVPSLAAQSSDILKRLPAMQESVAKILDGSKLTEPLARSIRSNGSREIAERAAPFLLSYSEKAFELLAYAATTLFLSLYLIIDRDRMRGVVFALVPRKYHVALARILLNLETIVGGYMRGQFITSVMMAVFTFVVLTIARVPKAIALATFAGLTDILPYIGAILACGPATLAATARGTPTMLFVLGALVIYQECESRFIVPRVYGRVLRLPSSMVMIALLVGGSLLGIVGALLALPIAAGIRMVVEELRLHLPGEDLDDAQIAVRDRKADRSYERRAHGEPAIEAAAIATEIAGKRIKEDEATGNDAAEVPITSGG
jgi:putative heme transporter